MLSSNSDKSKSLSSLSDGDILDDDRFFKKISS